ncbi:sentrin-specific protease 1-like [Olea europaea subsp. europaea]|uniref:Sentrin-specific protease 1-like n=1 Tax=Olea europaea subsp. europaea TaxID=158383 RepID=A0A8S0QXN5_OLEEU|nr:sentrin-specific protease 1-like [Olea europaea subsp. europaea]
MQDTPTAEPTFELLVKRVLRPVKILQSPFVAVERKLFKYDDIVVFENYKGRDDGVDSSAFMAWFQRGYKPRTKLIEFNSVGKSYLDWKVVKGIEPFVKILLALMNNLGISKKDPDYIEPSCMELKVTIDDTLPQQMNGHDCEIFVILYALYNLCEGRESIPHTFDTSKCRMDIVTLLYKHREMYLKRAR